MQVHILKWTKPHIFNTSTLIQFHCRNWKLSVPGFWCTVCQLTTTYIMCWFCDLSFQGCLSGLCTSGNAQFPSSLWWIKTCFRSMCAVDNESLYPKIQEAALSIDLLDCIDFCYCCFLDFFISNYYIKSCGLKTGKPQEESEKTRCTLHGLSTLLVYGTLS